MGQVAAAVASVRKTVFSMKQEKQTQTEPRASAKCIFVSVCVFCSSVCVNAFRRIELCLSYLLLCTQSFTPYTITLIYLTSA